MNKAFSKILIIIIGTAVVGGGIFAWQKWGAEKTETVGWKIFDNTKYSYSFQYPSEAKVEVEFVESGTPEELAHTSDVVYAVVNGNSIFDVQIYTPELFAGAPETSVLKQIVSLDLKTFTEMIWQYNKDDKNSNVPNKKVGEMTEKTIAGKEAYQFELSGSYADWQQGLLLEEPHLYSFVANERGDKFVIHFPKSNEQAREILKTFRFLDETAGWQIYRSEEHGFEIKYPKEINFSSMGPNSAQQAINKGEQISGTVQPSYDTIIFKDGGNELAKIEIFHKYEKDILPKNYKDEDYLYLYGPCDIRSGFVPASIDSKSINGINALAVKGSTYSCYYLKNSSGNLIVFSDSGYKPDAFEQIFSTFKFLK